MHVVVFLVLVAASASAHSLKLVASTSREADAFTYLFQWKYSSVARECEEVLGPYSYHAVCVDPPNEHLPGQNWYWRYQPVSYQLNSRGGNESEFVDMVRRCHAAGVRVYVDAVLNHMASARTSRGSVGIAGTAFGNRNFGGLYAPGEFHHNPEDLTSNCQMNGVTRRVLQECDLVGLPDLNTNLTSVQGKLVAFVQRLADAGVDGIRVDASRHMPAPELNAILAPVTGGMAFSMMEHVMDGGCQVAPSEYFEVAPGGPSGESRHMEFVGAAEVGLAFKSGNLAMLRSFGDPSRYVPSDKAVTFTDNHDLQRHARNVRGGHCRGCGGRKNCLGGCIRFAEHAVTFDDGALHTLANAFLLAHPYGYPCLMSSYNFSNSGEGPPEGTGRCGAGWVCEHRQPALLQMVRFRRETAHAPLTAFSTPAGSSRMAFARDGAGHVGLNAGSDPWEARGLQTTLPKGVYTDMISGQGVHVCDDGTTSVVVPPRGLVAILKTDLLAAASSREPNCTRPPARPRPGPGKAACSESPGCAHLAGDCCPHPDGTMLACCTSLAEVAAELGPPVVAVSVRRRRRSFYTQQQIADVRSSRVEVWEHARAS